MPHLLRIAIVYTVLCMGLLHGSWLDAQESEKALAAEILDASGVRAGLIVHLGCGDGKLTASLRANDGCLVQGLDTDAANVEKAREHIRSLGLYGRVSADRWDGKRLPYIDNLVNLVVVSGEGQVPNEELLRVLAPNGVALFINPKSNPPAGGQNPKLVKPRPKEIDEWTHYLHDASNNAVAEDTVVGPPRRVQWVGGPRWARSHEHLASVSAVVSAAGRIFYIVDEGPVASVALPAKWFLVARDAFNGVVLWKRPIASWESQMRAFRSGPPQLPRRLVAAGEQVYATLGYDAPLTALDAATGEIVRTYEGTRYTEEVICSGGVLFLVVNKNPPQQGDSATATRRGEPMPPEEKFVMALASGTGNILWKKETERLLPLTLAAQDERVFFQDGERVACLDAKTGQELWRSPPLASPPVRGDGFAPTIVVSEHAVLCADGKKLTAVSPKTGQTLWTSQCAAGFHSPVDIFVAGGLVWTWSESIASTKFSGLPVGRDPATGEVKKQFEPDETFRRVGMPHHRCYRNKATERYILAGRAGVEFVQLDTGKVCLHNWVRGGCQYGIMPCNGLLYAPSHSCACYIKSKLNGFYALGPASHTAQPKSNIPDEERLQRGPAYDQIQNPKSKIQNERDWPTYRHDPARSGFTKASVPTDLKLLWKVTPERGGKLSSAAVAEGKVFVASVDTHTVHALDADSGRPLWSYTVGGRVDSPPTICQGRVLSGSADGWVYCLRASDGELAWRFRCAPEDRRTVAYGELESVWPAHGNVLVEEGVAYAAAGRSSFLDGGIYLYRLDVKTGKKLSETRICGLDPETGQQPAVQGFEMEGALPDVLSSDGTFVYMRHVKFDLQGVQQEEPGLHLFSPTGFLDDSWWHRSYWIFGTSFSAGWGGWWRVGNRVPAGRILTFDESFVYGFGRSLYRNWWPLEKAGHWATQEQYHLFAASKSAGIVEAPPEKKRGKAVAAKSEMEYRWSQRMPLQVRAMVLADATLFVAGPPDLGNEGKEALAAFEGKKGCLLWAVRSPDGQKLAEYSLDSPPVFDGMIAANGRLYISAEDGSLLCMGRKP